MRRAMPHLSELHGAATHLAVVAVPLYAILLICVRRDVGGATVRTAAPWALGAALVGVGLAGLTGLLVHGDSETTLRGSHGTIGTLHLWLGPLLALVVAALVAATVWAHLLARRDDRPAPWMLGLALVATAVVATQGYLGGRMTYDRGVGVQSGGELAQSARGVADLERALAGGEPSAQAGKVAFSTSGLGCASCHGEHAQGERGPRLAGGRELEEFRRVHAHGLFPPRIVTDRDFTAIDAYLKTLAG